MKALYIGTRNEVFHQVLSSSLDLVKTIVLKNSKAEDICKEKELDYWVINNTNKKQIFEKIKALDFDILISNGCPFIIPISYIKNNQSRLFVNIHPSYLPMYKGMHPINGVLLNGEKYTGATMHFMDDELDNGDIIHQEKLMLTDEINLNLLYDCCFYLEGIVFKIGIEKIIKDHSHKGIKQVGLDSFYSREKNDSLINFNKDTAQAILYKIKAFSNGIVGAKVNTINGEIDLLEAKIIKNKVILNCFNSKNYNTGHIIKCYPNQFIIKCVDTLLFVTSYTSSFKVEIGVEL